MVTDVECYTYVAASGCKHFFFCVAHGREVVPYYMMGEEKLKVII